MRKQKVCWHGPFHAFLILPWRRKQWSLGGAQAHFNSLLALGSSSYWLLTRTDTAECAFWCKDSKHEPRSNSKPGLRIRLSFGMTQIEKLFDSQPLSWSHMPVFSLSRKGNVSTKIKPDSLILRFPSSATSKLNPHPRNSKFFLRHWFQRKSTLYKQV